MANSRPLADTTAKPRCLRIVLGIAFSMSVVTTVSAADDSYLDALDAEAAKTVVQTSDKDEVAVDAPEAAAPVDAAADAAAGGLAGMEAFLLNHAEGTYKHFYSKLDDAKKSVVLEQFTQSQDLKNLRRKIIELYTDR
ncbi:MAG: hypothetical protein ACPGUC_01240 [Gammaproteobacteria bacterium]